MLPLVGLGFLASACPLAEQARFFFGIQQLANWLRVPLSCCRYCSGKRGKGKKGKFGADYSGASHIAELHALLRATVMVSIASKNNAVRNVVHTTRIYFQR